MMYMTRSWPISKCFISKRFPMMVSFPGLIMLNPCSLKAALEGCLTLLRLRLAWIPLSLIFTVICRSDKSGLRKGGFTLTACLFLGSTMYLINYSTVIIKINNNLRTRHRDKKIFLLSGYDLRVCQNLGKQTPFISTDVITKKINVF